MTVPETILLSAGSMLIGVGVAWGTLKTQVRGTQRDIEALGKKMELRDGRIFDRIDECCKAIGEVSQRVANIEGWRNGKCK